MYRNFLLDPTVFATAVTDDDLIDQPIEKFGVKLINLRQLIDQIGESARICFHILHIRNLFLQIFQAGLQFRLLCLPSAENILEFALRNRTVQAVFLQKIKTAVGFRQTLFNGCLFCFGVLDAAFVCHTELLCNALNTGIAVFVHRFNDLADIFENSGI